MAGIRIGGVAMLTPYMAYMREYFDGTNTYWQIWGIPLAGGTPFQITSPTADGSLDSDPDVHQTAGVVFLRATAFGSPFLYRCDKDGSNVTLLDNAAACRAPMWNPAGTEIVYRVADSIVKINADGTGKTTLYTQGGGNSVAHPVWNRDGTMIAFHVDFSSGLTLDELWVMNADGSSPTKLSDSSRGGLGGLSLSWQHSADVIAFNERISSNNHVSKINADGTGKTQLTNAAIGPALTKYAWSTDDTLIFTPRTSATPWAMYQVPDSGAGQSAVSPSLELHNTVGAGQAFVYGDRIYTVRRTTQDLVSIMFDGSDLRVEDTPDLVGPDFLDLRLSGNGTEL